MSKNNAGWFIASAAVALLMVAPAAIHAQSMEDQPQGHEHMHGQMQGDDAGSFACCQQKKEEMKEMHAKQEAVQAELDRLAELVQNTGGKAQQAAMADLLVKLVEQRGQMSEMMLMHPEKMHHMKSGDMAGCPMMTKKHGEKSAEETPAEAEDHSQHH